MFKPSSIPLVKEDSWLEPFADQLAARMYRYKGMVHFIEEQFGSLMEFASVHTYLGLNYDAKAKGWWYREWAPSAHALYLTGDFNLWDRRSHPLKQNEERVWEIFLPDTKEGSQPGPQLRHGQKYKVTVVNIQGEFDRIPALANYVVQDEVTKDFAPEVYHPETPYTYKSKSPKAVKNPLIYEAHTGMSGEAERVASYREFADHIIPKIKKAGYDTIQLMAVQEHPYYGSYGYHVSSLYAPSSRFGTPDDLKYLVDTAHSAGLRIIMDLVHSHAVRNFLEGLDRFDGSEGQYFHRGAKGEHELWDSKLYNYGKPEVVQFLLSNVRYWLEEFKFDGFRFDGVTSMLYSHHGLGMDFVTYSDYFSDATDEEAILYLQLANTVAHTTDPNSLTVAEDMSGMPGLCRPIEEGGVGFDARLGMGLPDFWIKAVKETRDEDWDPEAIYYQMLNRRKGEKTIAYVESHDQALVGDQTLSFRLMGPEMYTSMAKDQQSLVVDRGMAIHKLIRLITISLGGEGWLNFMGNEFGHPEWIDFPRIDNNWSYRYARRQWSLEENGFLRYGQLGNFDRAMVELVKKYDVLGAENPLLVNADRQNQSVAFARAGLVFLFNFHPTNAVPDYAFYVPEPGKYTLVLCSDDEQFGGQGRIKPEVEYFSDDKQMIRCYNTNRTAQVFKRID